MYSNVNHPCVSYLGSGYADASHEKIYEKPVDLLIQEFVARILEINTYFLYYQEPIPGISETKILDRDIKDLVDFGLPNH